MKNKIQHARRMQDIQPFRVMQLLARARELEAAGRDIVHMEIGEPDFPTTRPVIEAAIAKIQTGDIHYTPATGLAELRQAIAGYYQHHCGVSVAAERIVITLGASGALLLVLGVLLNPKQKVLMADPGYPCNRNFVRFLEAQVQSIAVDVGSDYQLTPTHIKDHWCDDAAAVLVASPSNPTGTLIQPQHLAEIVCFVKAKQGHLIVDEIYHSLTYGEEAKTALHLEQDVFVINSFSKYFGMTGWRLGWLVAPESYIGDLDKLAQNLFLSAPTAAQYAALAAFSPQNIQILEQRRMAFQQRRDYLLPALRELGFSIPITPQGAFYLYAGCDQFTDNSFEFAQHLLEQAGVAITPGNDFGTYQAETHVRFAYTTSLDRLEEGIRRLKDYL